MKATSWYYISRLEEGVFWWGREGSKKACIILSARYYLIQSDTGWCRRIADRGNVVWYNAFIRLPDLHALEWDVT
jgi:hypothetical protein